MEQMFKGKNEHGGVAGVLGTGMRPDLNTGPTPEALRGKEVKKTDCTCQILQIISTRVFMALPLGGKMFSGLCEVTRGLISSKMSA